MTIAEGTEPVEKLRICTVCGESKPKTPAFFYRRGLGLGSTCKECVRAPYGPRFQWCSHCHDKGHSAHACTNPPAVVASMTLPEKPPQIAGAYWVACHPSFPADHPAWRVPLGSR